MKITFLVNYDLASTFALNRLMSILRQHQISIFFTNKATNPNRAPQLIALSEFETRLLDQLNESKSQADLMSIDRLGTNHCLSTNQLNSINDADFHHLELSEPDLIISIRHMTILKECVIALPKNGVINLHSGLLPEYQGVMASFWAMLNREAELGSTLHYISDTAIDKGAIISRSEVACEYQKSYLWNVLNQYRSGCEMIIDAIEIIEKYDSVDAQEQNGDSQYFSFPIERDINNFIKAGNCLFAEKELIEFGFA